MKTNYKIPFIVRTFMPKAIFRLDTSEKCIYLSFDDGPHPVGTPKILKLLEKYQAQATFFCLGKNAEIYPEICQSIKQGGNSIGNHSYSHKDAFKCSTHTFLNDISQASEVIETQLLRLPYGHITPSVYNKLKNNYKLVFWDVMPGDFIEGVLPENFIANFIKHTRSGSIVVLHDKYIGNEKLLPALEHILNYYSSLGFRFCAI